MLKLQLRTAPWRCKIRGEGTLAKVCSTQVTTMLGQQLTKEEVEDFMREADVVSDITEVQNRNKWSQI